MTGRDWYFTYRAEPFLYPVGWRVFQRNTCCWCADATAQAWWVVQYPVLSFPWPARSEAFSKSSRGSVGDSTGRLAWLAFSKVTSKSQHKCTFLKYPLSSYFLHLACRHQARNPSVTVDSNGFLKNFGSRSKFFLSPTELGSTWKAQTWSVGKFFHTRKIGMVYFAVVPSKSVIHFVTKTRKWAPTELDSA